MTDKIYKILDAFFTPGEEKLLSDLQRQLTELFEKELLAQRQELCDVLLKNGHGGGNFRRLITLLRGKKEVNG